MASNMVRSGKRLIPTEYALLAALIACLTYAMRGFAVCYFWLQRQHEHARWQPFQLVALLLCLPCFKLCHTCFKAAYFFGHFRLARLGRRSALLGGKDLSLEFDDRIPKCKRRSQATALNCGMAG